MRFPPKLVSVLCVMQVFVIVGACLMVGSFRKFNAIAKPEWVNPPLSYPLASRMFYYCGPWLLLVPLVWGWLATTRAEIGQGYTVVSEEQGWIGWGVTGAVALFCGYAAWQTFLWTFVVPYEMF